MLNLLSGREKGMSLDSGKILINGKKATKRLRRGIGYVLQEDVFFSHLTVNQTLQVIAIMYLFNYFSPTYYYFFSCVNFLYTFFPPKYEPLCILKLTFTNKSAISFF